MKSTYLNYDTFRRPVGDAMKLSTACFGCFECTSPLARLSYENRLQENYIYIHIHVENMYNHFHDFRRSIFRAMIKIAIVIENGRSLKLRQTRRPSCHLQLD